jgi:hypothetical protein
VTARWSDYHVAIDEQQVTLTSESYDLTRIRDFYRPYYDLLAGPAARPVAVVHVACSGARAGEEPVLAMGRYLAGSSPSVQTVNGRQVELFARPVDDVRIRVDRAAGRIDVLGDHPVHVDLQVRTLVRDQLLGQLERARGWVVFHAAAVCRDDVGVAFMGDRNAGKTTSLIALMSTGQWDFLSGDRVKLLPDATGLQMRGMPARCNLHRVSIERDPFLQPLAAGRRYDAEDKCLIDVAELTTLAGVGHRAGARLRVLVLPTLHPRYGQLTWRVVTDATSARRLVAAQLMEGTPVDKHRHWLNYLPDQAATLTHRLGRVLDALVGSVTVVTVESSYARYVEAIRAGEFDPCSFVS